MVRRTPRKWQLSRQPGRRWPKGKERLQQNYAEMTENITRAQVDASAWFLGHPLDPMSNLVHRLSWALNRYSGAPTTFVLSAGFLAVVYATEQAGARERK